MTKYYQSNCRDNCNKTKIKTIRKKSIFLNLFVGCLVLVFGGFYLFKTNLIAVEGYRVDELQNKVSELKDQNKKLELQAVELRSITDLKKRIEAFNMVKVETISHIDKVNTAVALR